MANRAAIHETVIRDIIDIAQDLKDRDEVKWITDRQSEKSFASITSKSKGMTMVFPVLGSTGCPFDELCMVAKALEKKFVILLDMLFSAACISNVATGEEFIKRFHTNINLGRMTMDDFSKMLSDFVEESGIINKMDAVMIENYNKVLSDMQAMNCYFEDTVEEGSIDDYTFIPSESGYNLIGIPRTTVTEARHHRPVDTDEQLYIDDRMANTYKNYAQGLKAELDIEKGRIMDAEIKKANELAPTLMVVNFISTNNGYEPIHSSFLLGVKAKLYAVDSEDVMNRLEIKHTDRNLGLNLVKVSSGEISFFRDFLLGIDRAKIDAISMSRRGSSNKLWRVLERRAVKSKIRRGLSMSNDATAISTLVISQEEVEYMKKTRYLDVESPRTISPIMDAYNLMGFVILDSSLEVAKFLFDDGEGVYEVITYTNLEREQRDNSKKIVNLMTKMSR